MELPLGIHSVVKTSFCPDQGQMHSEVDSYTMSLPAQDIKQNPRLAGLLDIADSWWGSTGCVIAAVDGVGENVRYSMEVCNTSGEPGREGDWSREAHQDEIRRVFGTWHPAPRKLLKQPGHANIWRLARTTPNTDPP